MGLILRAVGGDFRGDLDPDRNMLSVVVARVIDRPWKGCGIGKDFEDRASGEAVTEEEVEKADGDIGGLTLLDIVAYWAVSDVELGEMIGLGSERPSGALADSIGGSGRES